MLQAQVRLEIYTQFAATGCAPAPAELAALLGRGVEEMEQTLVQLADAHVIALAPGSRSVWMAHPFSAAPTPYRVRAGGVSYWANCAWDALAIAVVVERDTECTARCPECNERVDLSVRGGRAAGEGIIHFVVPARRFWKNVAFT
jgi:hypothetical protein